MLAKATATTPRVLYSEHFTDGAALYERVRGMNLEGVVSKRADAPYRSGRGGEWVKVKCWKRERFAVIGFVPEGSRTKAEEAISRASSILPAMTAPL